MKKAIVLFTLVVVFSATTMGQDSTSVSSILVNVGTVELLTMPHLEHIGTYVYVGISWPIPISKVTTLLPGLSVEFSPELGNWGVVAAVAVDVMVSRSVGLDAQLLVVHDQPALRFNQVMFFIGPGVGVSLYLGSIVVSPSVNTFYGLSDGSWSLAPSINVSW